MEMPHYPEFGSLYFDDAFINELFTIEQEELALQRKKLLDPYGDKIPFDAAKHALEFVKIQRSVPVLLMHDVECEFMSNIEEDFGLERNIAVCADVVQVIDGAKVIRPKLYVGRSLFFSIEASALNWDDYYNGNAEILDIIPGNEVYMHLAVPRNTYDDIGSLVIALAAINEIREIS